MACCPGGAHEVLADELAELASDPTLLDCCRRDLEDQSRNAAIKAQLLAQDPTQTRQILTAQAVCRDAVALSEAEGEQDDGMDMELERLRQLRLQELQSRAEQQAKQPTQHNGKLTTVNEPTALEAVSTAMTVCHLALEGTSVCDAVDECLSSLAHSHPSVRFIRCVVQPTSRLHHKLDLEPGPGLLCRKTTKGDLISASLALFGAPFDLREDRMERWVRINLGLSSADANLTNQEESEDDKEVGEEKACAVCGRSYPHEHVRSVRAQHYDTYSSDDEQF